MILLIPFASRSRQALVMLIALVAVLATALTACTAPPPAPTPDIPATVTAQVRTHLDSVPTATPLPTHTPYPTATPYPTPTALATYTPYPTATPRPTLVALPTHTPYLTATPRPTYTPAHTASFMPMPTIPVPTPTPYGNSLFDWTVVEPLGWYSLELPASVSAPEHFPPPQDNYYGVVSHTMGWETVIISVVYAEYPDTGTVGYSAAEAAAWYFDSTSTWDTFVMEELVAPSNSTRRSHYTYTDDEFCSGDGYGLHVIKPIREIHVLVEICDAAPEQYNEAFADRILNSFAYSEMENAK